MAKRDTPRHEVLDTCVHLAVAEISGVQGPYTCSSSVILSNDPIGQFGACPSALDVAPYERGRPAGAQRCAERAAPRSDRLAARRSDRTGFAIAASMTGD